MIVPFDSAPFGRITTLLSGVSTFVAVIFTSTTFARIPCASIRSPALKGLKANSISPPAKFCTVPDSAIPIAKPPAANSAARDVVSTPSVLMEITTVRIVSVMEVNEVTKEAMVGSVFRRSNSFFSPCFIARMRNRPTIKIAKAAKTLRPNISVLSLNTSQNPLGSVRAYSIICRAPARTESRCCWICSAVGVATCNKTASIFIVASVYRILSAARTNASSLRMRRVAMRVKTKHTSGNDAHGRICQSTPSASFACQI